MGGGTELRKAAPVYSDHTVSTAGWTTDGIKHTSVAERKLPQSSFCGYITPDWIPPQSYLTCVDSIYFPVGMAFGQGLVHTSLTGKEIIARRMDLLGVPIKVARISSSSTHLLAGIPGNCGSG